VALSTATGGPIELLVCDMVWCGGCGVLGVVLCIEWYRRP